MADKPERPRSHSEPRSSRDKPAFKSPTVTDVPEKDNVIIPDKTPSTKAVPSSVASSADVEPALVDGKVEPRQEASAANGAVDTQSAKPEPVKGASDKPSAVVSIDETTMPHNTEQRWTIVDTGRKSKAPASDQGNLATKGQPQAAPATLGQAIITPANKQRKKKKVIVDKSATDMQRDAASRSESEAKSEASAEHEGGVTLDAHAKHEADATLDASAAPVPDSQSANKPHEQAAEPAEEDQVTLVDTGIPESVEPLPTDLSQFIPHGYMWPYPRFDIYKTPDPDDPNEELEVHIPTGDAMHDLYRHARPQMYGMSYDDSCKEGLARWKELAKRDVRLFKWIHDSPLWRDLSDVVSRLLPGPTDEAGAVNDMTFKNTQGVGIDLGEFMEHLKDQLLLALPTVFDQLCESSNLVAQEAQDSAAKSGALLNKVQECYERAVVTTKDIEASNDSHNQKVKGILANWDMQMKEVFAEIAKQQRQPAIVAAVQGFLEAHAAPIIKDAMREKLKDVDQRVRALRNMHDQIVELQGVLMQMDEDQKKRVAAMPQDFVSVDTLETMRQAIMAFIVKGVKHLSADDDELEARVAELETAARQPKPKSDISRLEERLTKLEAANAKLVREKKDDRETITRLNDKVTGLTATVTELSGTVADQEEVVQLARAALEAPA